MEEKPKKTTEKKKLTLQDLQRYLNPKALNDLDKLLDRMPITVGYNAIIGAALVWVFAGMAFMFASGETTRATELRAEMLAVEALQPPVPEIKYVPVSKEMLEETIARVAHSGYQGLTIRVDGPGNVTISGATGVYPQFRDAIGQFSYGDRGWRVDVQSLCVGQGCDGSGLHANLKVSAARILSAEEVSAAAEAGI